MHAVLILHNRLILKFNMRLLISIPPAIPYIIMSPKKRPPNKTLYIPGDFSHKAPLILYEVISCFAYTLASKNIIIKSGSLFRSTLIKTPPIIEKLQH